MGRLAPLKKGIVERKGIFGELIALVQLYWFAY